MQNSHENMREYVHTLAPGYNAHAMIFVIFAQSIADQEPECLPFASHSAMKFEYLGFLLALNFTLSLGAGDHPYEWGI